jgi:hypothetical protein
MKKLAKMQMPKKRMNEMEISEESMAESPEMEMEGEDMEDMEDMELSEMEGEGEEESNPALENLSDDELMAEIKKRGLMSQLEESDSEDKDSQENYF